MRKQLLTAIKYVEAIGAMDTEEAIEYYLHVESGKCPYSLLLPRLIGMQQLIAEQETK